jgi:hypothetical protein
VVSEAIAARVPILASAISGNRGLLGEQHPAYYSAENTAELLHLRMRAESDTTSLRAVQAHARTREHLFTPQREQQAWAALLDELF